VVGCKGERGCRRGVSEQTRDRKTRESNSDKPPEKGVLAGRALAGDRDLVGEKKKRASPGGVGRVKKNRDPAT